MCTNFFNYDKIIRNTGTMSYPAKSINKCIKGITFKNKTKNIIANLIQKFVI